MFHLSNVTKRKVKKDTNTQYAQFSNNSVFFSLLIRNFIFIFIKIHLTNLNRLPVFFFKLASLFLQTPKQLYIFYDEQLVSHLIPYNSLFE